MRAAGTNMVFLLLVPLIVAFWHSAAWPRAIQRVDKLAGRKQSGLILYIQIKPLL
jgi:hypothetical protein